MWLRQDGKMLETSGTPNQSWYRWEAALKCKTVYYELVARKYSPQQHQFV
jgi:hypothetical protein